MASLAKPFESGVRKALTDALKGSYEVVFSNVVENLSGRVLQRRTGRSLENVRQNSRLTRDGFAIGTTAPNLIAFEKGSPRKAYFVAPVQAQALRWIDSGGKEFFSRGHWIPAWRFPVRVGPSTRWSAQGLARCAH